MSKTKDKSIKIIYLLKGSFFLLVIFFYLLIPPFLHSYNNIKIDLIIFSGIIFIFYSFLRYYILLFIYKNTKDVILKLFFHNGSLFLSLLILYVSEGFLNPNNRIYSFPSLNFIDIVIIVLFLPTLYSNSVMIKSLKRLNT